VDFQFVLAGPGHRAYAWLIDMLLRMGVLVLTSFVLLVVGVIDINLLQMSSGMLLMLIFAMDWFYGSLFEAGWNGQTPGKRIAGLRVVRTNGTPVDLTSAIGRNFLRTADMLPACYTVGLICMALTRRLQRLGDLLFDTMVIEDRTDWHRRIDAVSPDVPALLRSECPAGFHVPERTLAVIERLLTPDRMISDARREEIARPLSEVLHQRLGYVDPGPDPTNPYTFFAQQGVSHTKFLTRVLKTFSEGPGESRPLHS
jgi:uncharacterized RDD family membrane protein YckC